MKMVRFAMLVLAAVALAAAPALAQKVQINGAGATFPNPIYQKWFSEYNKLHPEIEINYQSIGSGGGIRRSSTRRSSSGDRRSMTDSSCRARGQGPSTSRRCSAVTCPCTTSWASDAELKFTGPSSADIFLGQGHEVERRDHS